jgi:uncharacterized protein (TIGR03437 family)
VLQQLLTRFLLAALALLSPAVAQTLSIGNAAIPELAGLTNVAPGSLAVVDPYRQIQFPVPIDLSSIHLDMQPRDGAQVFPMTVLSAGSTILALVPADVPIGWTTVTLTVNQSSLTGTVYVARSSFALFNQGTFGSGPAIAQNVPESGPPVLNQLTSPALPGQYVTLWGTGLGDFTTSDVSIQVYGAMVQPSFAGRAPGQPGLDQINFRLPANVPAGCYIPVAVTVGGSDVSNQVTLATSSSPTSACIHPLGLTPSQLKTLDQGGTVVTGSLTTDTWAYALVAGDQFTRYETFSLSFLNANSQDVFTGALTPQPTTSSCSLASVSTNVSFGVPGSWPVLVPTFPDAGSSITVSGPIPAKLTIAKSNNSYSLRFESQPAPSLAALAPPFFPGGSYTLAAPGGTDILAFELAFTLPPPLTWTNRDQLGTIDRNADLVLAWDNQGYAPTDTVSVILASSPSAPVVVCTAPAQAGKLVITRDLLQKITSATATLSMSVTPDSSRPRFISVPLKAGGTAPVPVSRYSSEAMPVALR